MMQGIYLFDCRDTSVGAVYLLMVDCLYAHGRKGEGGRASSCLDVERVEFHSWVLANSLSHRQLPLLVSSTSMTTTIGKLGMYIYIYIYIRSPPLPPLPLGNIKAHSSHPLPPPSPPPSASSSSPSPTSPNPDSYRNAAPPQPTTRPAPAYHSACTPCSSTPTHRK